MLNEAVGTDTDFIVFINRENNGYAIKLLHRL